MDHQVVAMQFEGGATATLTVVAFSEVSPQNVLILFEQRIGFTALVKLE